MSSSFFNAHSGSSDKLSQTLIEIADYQIGKPTADAILVEVITQVDKFLRARDPDYNDFSSRLLKQQFMPK